MRTVRALLVTSYGFLNKEKFINLFFNVKFIQTVSKTLYLENERNRLIKQIQKAGGLYEVVATYISNANDADDFIKMCFEQSKYRSARDLWGQKLINRIVEYNNTNLIGATKSNDII